MAKLELYGTRSCPYTQELRESLEWNRCEFVEFDVETDSEERERLRAVDGSIRTVPVLVAEGKVIQIGWQGRGCVVGWRS